MKFSLTVIIQISKFRVYSVLCRTEWVMIVLYHSGFVYQFFQLCLKLCDSCLSHAQKQEAAKLVKNSGLKLGLYCMGFCHAVKLTETSLLKPEVILLRHVVRFLMLALQVIFCMTEYSELLFTAQYESIQGWPLLGCDVYYIAP